MSQHTTFILIAYGFAAACVIGELMSIVHRRRAAIDRVRRERDVDDEEAQPA